MKLMRVPAVLIAIFAALIYASTAGAEQGKRVALLTGPLQSPYVGAYNPSFIKVLEGQGVKVTNLTTPFDPAIQSQQVDDAIAQKFDLIAITPANNVAIIPALERAARARVPVVLLITPLAPGNDRLYVTVVGNDQTELGEIAGNELIKALGGRPAKVAVIQGVPTQYLVQLRTEGFKKAIAKVPNIHLVATEAANWRTDTAENIAQQLFVRFAPQGGLQGIYAMADNMAAGVIQSAETAGLHPGKDLMVVSSTCQKEGIPNIRSGKQFSAVDQIPTREGQLAANVVLRVLKGEPVKKHEIIPAKAVDKSNVDQYVQACTF